MISKETLDKLKARLDARKKGRKVCKVRDLMTYLACCAADAEVLVSNDSGDTVGVTAVLTFDKELQVWICTDDLGQGWNPGPDADGPSEEEAEWEDADKEAWEAMAIEEAIREGKLIVEDVDKYLNPTPRDVCAGTRAKEA